MDKKVSSDAYLFPVDEDDKFFIDRAFPKIVVKDHERMYRYVTPNMVMPYGDSFKLNIMPLIKVNLKNKMIYFLDEEGEKFETRGTKLLYIRLRSSEKDA